MNQQLGDLLITFALRWFIGWMFSTMKYSNFFINKPPLNIVLFFSRKPVPFYSIIWQIINYAFLMVSLINLYSYVISYNKLLYIYLESSYYGMIICGIVIMIDVLAYKYNH